MMRSFRASLLQHDRARSPHLSMTSHLALGWAGYPSPKLPIKDCKLPQGSSRPQVHQGGAQAWTGKGTKAVSGG